MTPSFLLRLPSPPEHCTQSNSQTPQWKTYFSLFVGLPTFLPGSQVSKVVNKLQRCLVQPFEKDCLVAFGVPQRLEPQCPKALIGTDSLPSCASMVGRVR